MGGRMAEARAVARLTTQLCSILNQWRGRVKGGVDVARGGFGPAVSGGEDDLNWMSRLASHGEGPTQLFIFPIAYHAILIAVSTVNAKF